MLGLRIKPASRPLSFRYFGQPQPIICLRCRAQAFGTSIIKARQKTKAGKAVLERLRNRNASEWEQRQGDRQNLYNRDRDSRERTVTKSEMETFITQFLAETKPKKECEMHQEPFIRWLAYNETREGGLNLTYEQLVTTLKAGGAKALWRTLPEAYEKYKQVSSASKYIQGERKSLADLRYPTEWFPRARAMRRTWHLHLGPTNSGKTYNALKRLEQAESGVYAGPLRLLAREIHDRLNAKGILCNLVTGEERRRVSEEAKIVSCTVEMVDLMTKTDVAVIDEIQMISDDQRGWAWTQALLGLKAKEIHICGELRAMSLIKKLAELTGDELVVHKYERLGPLAVEKTPLGGLDNIQKGDCVVSFSRRNIYILAKEIEKTTGHKCAVVYGSLPPETRAAQARLFNDPNSDIKVLVASDAVGMGLNLSIRRIIFSAMMKYNGIDMVPIPIPQVLQIAGRAGRYRVSHDDTGTKKAVEPSPADPPPSESTDEVILPPTGPLPPAPRIGYVTTMKEDQLPFLREAMVAQVDQLTTAMIQPLPDTVEMFAQYFENNTPFSTILEEMMNSCRTTGVFSICKVDDPIAIAKIIDKVPGLTYAERFKICVSPAKLKEEATEHVLRAFADVIGQGKQVTILDVKQVDLEALDAGVPRTEDELKRLENLHATLTLYMWLAQRFPGNFVHMDTTIEVKNMCEKQIEEGLLGLRSKFVRKPLQGKAPKQDLLRMFPSPSQAAEQSYADKHEDKKDDGDDDDDMPDMTYLLEPQHRVHATVNR